MIWIFLCERCIYQTESVYRDGKQVGSRNPTITRFETRVRVGSRQSKQSQKLLIKKKKPTKQTLKEKAKFSRDFCLQSCDEWEIHSTQLENIQPMKHIERLQLKFIPVKLKKGKTDMGLRQKEERQRDNLLLPTLFVCLSPLTLLYQSTFILPGSSILWQFCHSDPLMRFLSLTLTLLCRAMGKSLEGRVRRDVFIFPVLFQLPPPPEWFQDQGIPSLPGGCCSAL